MARSSPESAAGIIIEGGGILVVVVVEPRPGEGGTCIVSLTTYPSTNNSNQQFIVHPTEEEEEINTGAEKTTSLTPLTPFPRSNWNLFFISLSLSPLLLSSFPRVSCTRCCCCCCMSVDCRSAGNVRCIRRRGTIAGDSGNDRLQGSLSQSTAYVSCFEVWGRIYARLAFLRRPPYM